MNWQPIDTAPKDGTRVIVSSKSKRVGEAEFSTHENYWFWVGTDNYVTPTHWMPLPDPPEE